MIYSPFIIISLPLIVSCFVAYLLFNNGFSFYENTILLFSALFFMTLIIELGLRLFNVRINVNPYNFIKNETSSKIALLFGFALLFFCIVDLCVKGPTLLTDPENYYSFTAFEAKIRHITIMCWALIPIGLLCTKNKSIRYTFIATAILFPIIAVDRNRLTNSLYALLVTFILMNKDKLNKEFLRKHFAKIISLSFAFITAFLLLFTYIGEKRSPIQYILNHDPLTQRQGLLYKRFTHSNLRDVNINHISPFVFNESFVKYSPKALTWLAIYTSSSFFNFSNMININYKDPEFLNYQIFRHFKDVKIKTIEDLNPLPTPITNLTVGTEFFPILLYGGPLLVIFSFFLLCVIYTSYLVFLWKNSASIFIYMGFIKLSYCCLMLGFGPQFFTLTNLGFLVLMIILNELCRPQPLLKPFHDMIFRLKLRDQKSI